ncbi:hypothetical protein [Anaerovibrio sp.]|uniref:hypothetical protein n=1 Tax=Anaerovibrio sp. TaxID=1872532 RepID=UPI003F14DB5E
MIDKCKLTASLGMAALAGLTAMAAGLMGEVRVSVILGRTLCSFLITGVLVYIGVFLFERIGFSGMIRETENALAELEAQEKSSGAGAAEASGDGAAEEGDMQPEDGGTEEQQGGFEPLQADSLRRVVGSADSQ